MRADRIGLVIVLASILAVTAIAYLVFDYEHERRIEQTRTQGVSLVRALAGVPFTQLAPGGAQQGVMSLLKHGAQSNDFAYVSIVNSRGITVNELVSDGLIIPPFRSPEVPSAWLGEAQLSLPGDQGKIIEFYAPLLESGELQGFIRLGYRYPTFGLAEGELPFIAAVSLPVFLLAPLFYFLLRREIAPVQRANQEIGRMMDGDQFRQVEISATGELGNFMRRFNRFIELANSRIEGLEQDQKQLITSTKLLTYRKNRVETVLETLPEAVMILDESGTITFANQKLAALFNVSQQAITSQPPSHWCDNPDILQLLGKFSVDGKGRGFTDTIRFNLSSLTDQSIVTKTYPLFAPNSPSSSIGTLIIFRDETKEALARQARTDFVAHLSHELKSPLNVLGMYSESLLSDAGKSEEFRVEAANVISEEVHRLSTLITGLLNITQIESGSLSPQRNLVKLQDVAAAAFDEAKHSAADRNFVFHFDAPNEMNPLLLDKDLIRIAITNLLSNAVKYNKDDGEIWLSIEETEDAVQIRVADSGIGISEDDANRIFDKFYRSDDERVQSIGGHGLGLALTKQIVELHHGSLSINHERPEGAEFIINLWKETTAVRQAI